MKQVIKQEDVISLEAHLLMAIHHHSLYNEARKAIWKILDEEMFTDSTLTEYIDETIMTGHLSVDVQGLLLLNGIEVEL